MKVHFLCITSVISLSITHLLVSMDNSKSVEVARQDFLKSINHLEITLHQNHQVAVQRLQVYEQAVRDLPPDQQFVHRPELELAQRIANELNTEINRSFCSEDIAYAQHVIEQCTRHKTGTRKSNASASLQKDSSDEESESYTFRPTHAIASAAATQPINPVSLATPLIRPGTAPKERSYINDIKVIHLSEIAAENQSRPTTPQSSSETESSMKQAASSSCSISIPYSDLD